MHGKSHLEACFDLNLQEKNWEHSGQEDICKTPFFSEFSLNFWPVRVHEKSGASFRTGDFAPREPEFGVEFWDANF